MRVYTRTHTHKQSPATEATPHIPALRSHVYAYIRTNIYTYIRIFTHTHTHTHTHLHACENDRQRSVLLLHARGLVSRSRALVSTHACENDRQRSVLLLSQPHATELQQRAPRPALHARGLVGRGRGLGGRGRGLVSRKQAELQQRALRPALHAALRQYLYFCSSKSKKKDW